MSAKKIVEAIHKYSKFLISSHIHVEGDALGSELALASLIKKLGKKAYVVNSDKTPSNYEFLPGQKDIYYKRSGPLLSYQAAFIIDCPERERIGKVNNFLFEERPIINIDHHLGNRNFGAVNWVDSSASSVGEMVYQLFKLTRTKLDRNDALNIYTAILTDTGSFQHCNTTSKVLLICSELLKFGINPAEVYAKIYDNNSAEDAIYIAKIISQMSFTADQRIAWVEISERYFKKLQHNSEALDRVIAHAKSIRTVKIIILFCQLNRDLIKLTFRAKGDVDVHRIASSFGGGGHKLASGCQFRGSLKQAKGTMLKEAKRALRRAKYGGCSRR